MDFVEAYAVFERLGIPAPVTNETFIRVAAEKIVELEKLTSLSRLGPIKTGDLLLVKSDTISESEIVEVRKHIEAQVDAKILLMCVGEDDDVHVIRKLESGDVLVIRSDDPLSMDVLKQMLEKLRLVAGSSGKVGIIQLGADDRIDRIKHETFRAAVAD